MSHPAQRILYAVRTQNHARLRALLAADARTVSARSLAGRTALHAAAEEGDYEAARLLLEAGADVNARMHTGETPLHRAAAYGGACDLLDPDPERRDPFRRKRKALHPRTAHAFTEILKARIPGLPAHLEAFDTIPAEHKFDALISLLDCFSDPAQLTQELQARSIDVARTDPELAEELRGQPRFLRVVELLVAQGADITAQTETGESVLHGVIERGRPAMLELLLRHGALPDHPGTDGESPPRLIDLALEYSKPELAEILLRHGARFDPEAIGPLHTAASNCRIGALNWLLDHGAPIDQRDEQGDTPLLAGCGHAESVACLLARGADARLRNARGQSVLHLCAGWTQCLVLVLPLGLPLDEPDTDGKTPLHLAAQSASPEAVTLLAAAGAAVDAHDHEGNTALHLLLVSDEFRPDIEFPVFHALVKAGANRAIRNHESSRPIDVARKWAYPPEYIDLLDPDPATAKPASAFIGLNDAPHAVLLPETLVSFDHEGRTWPSSAHLFLAQKTDDPALRETIRQAATVEAAQCRLRESGAPLPLAWAAQCDARMQASLFAKFSGNPTARAALLATGDALLVSSGDSYWTERPAAPFNTLGQLLMTIRAELRPRTSLA